MLVMSTVDSVCTVRWMDGWMSEGAVIDSIDSIDSFIPFALVGGWSVASVSGCRLNESNRMNLGRINEYLVRHG